MLEKGGPVNLVLPCPWRGGRISILFLVLLLTVWGCGHPRLPSEEELDAFREAGPIQVQVDLDRVVQARPRSGPYRVIKGDVLALTMPQVMRAVWPERLEGIYRYGQIEPYYCRVSDVGTISLPLVGEMAVAGKTCAEIEKAIADAYHPKYLKERPSVVAKVDQYQTQLVTVMGAVEAPGQYELRHDEMSLVCLLMKAGGVVEEGANLIRIHRGGGGEVPILLPVKGFKTPFRDVPLRAGDIVEVEEFVPRELMVMGLVNNPGSFPYPPNARYNLLQALAMAGGVDMGSNPRYAKVYRQTGDGTVICATFPLNTPAFTSGASRLTMKPGDVVSVDHTARTLLRQFFRDFMRVGFGLSAGYQLNPE